MKGRVVAPKPANDRPVMVVVSRTSDHGLWIFPPEGTGVRLVVSSTDCKQVFADLVVSMESLKGAIQVVEGSLDIEKCQEVDLDTGELKQIRRRK